MVENDYKLSSDFPEEEKYGLTSQIRRCVVSFASNIVEGAGRNTNGEFKNFVSNASGSTYELITQLTLAYRLDFISKKEFQPILSDVQEIQKINFALIRHLKS